MWFPRKSYKIVIFLGKMQEINALEGNRQFSVNFGKYLLFPVIGLIKKDLARNKVYNYFNVGDAKTLVKLNEK